jgi:hypothetical protein
MSRRRSLIGATLIGAIIVAGIGGCDGVSSQSPVASAPSIGSDTSAAPLSSAARSATTPQSAADRCGTSRRVLSDLQTLGSGTSTSLDSAALNQVNGTLSDLKRLDQAAPSAQMASLATSISTSLTGIASLARSDPQGAQADTHARARTLEQQYLTSSQQLASEITQACP